MTEAVACHQISKTYGKGESRVMALRGVDLTAARGEILMLVGPSGCGKTTLISIIAGILDADDGTCTVLGKNQQAMRGQERVAFRARHVGFVFQQFNLLPMLSAAQNAAIPLLLNGVPMADSIKQAEAWLAQVGLAGRGKARPQELSGGQQQRVAIARALIHRPALIVCDEPTSALDHQTGNQIMQMLRSLAHDGGQTLIIVTHDERIFPFADRIARMDDGRVVGFGTTPTDGVAA